MRLTYNTIDEYIEVFPKDVQALLRKVRSTIKSAAPETTEGISYGIPTFYLNGKYLVYFAGFKNHISVYPATTAALDNVKGLSAYKVSKGTLRFPLTKPIPFHLIKQFVNYRMKEEITRLEKRR
jgi:uncharacterized protein YdhG (YjbR/CyaY superfamily)